jgi:hypothetical protein
VIGGVCKEIRSTQELHKAAMRQVHSYLRASNLELGLLLHFGPDPKFYRVYVPNDPKPGREELCRRHGLRSGADH